MKILIVDNHIDADSWGARDLVRLTRTANHPTGGVIHVRRGPERDLPSSPEGYDRIIVSGSKMSILEDSPWVDDLLQFIHKTIDSGVPFLGICYGHQALVRAIGGKNAVRLSPKPEFGWTEIQNLGPSPLFSELPKTFYSFSAHFDEAAYVPSGVKVLARSEFCEVQACQLEGKPVFGIQFHPEKLPESAERVLAERKKLGDPKYLLNSNLTKKLYDPQIGISLFNNFLTSKAVSTS